MRSDIDGLNDVLRNMDAAEKRVFKAALSGMDYGVRDAANHVKVAYSRPRTGKGFTDRTGTLRNSRGSKAGMEKEEVVGYVHAGWGPVDYAGHVEMRWEGKYAYLWPGTNDKAKDIKDAVADSVKVAIK
jgi:glyoxylate utilization-related uncharacterized protein